MPQVTGSISLQHAATMPLPISDIRQRITDIEERHGIPRMSSNAAREYVRSRCDIVMARALGIIPRGI